MHKKIIPSFFVIVILIFFSCKTKNNAYQEKKKENAGLADTVTTALNKDVDLPAPYATPSVKNYSDVIGWPQGKTPIAPAGFTVTKFADSLDNPRWIYIGPNGDIFISEANSNTSSSANDIIMFRDSNHDGVYELRSVFLSGLNQPFGMLIKGNYFYVGNTDGVIKFPYVQGQTTITSKGIKVIDLPAGGYNSHWTRNLLASKDDNKIFVTVGSGSNAGEHGIENETRRANILEIDPDGSDEIIYASGLRNPQGMGYAPGTNILYTSVNERDDLGDGLVPDYLTSVKKNGFYGWPYSYWGAHEDPRLKGQRPDLVKQAIIPDVSMGAHTASLGLAFDEENQLPGKYKGGAFIGQHGSWNNSQLSGYQVAFVPFFKGKPIGTMEPFLTGFIANRDNKKVYGRPVGVAITSQGEMFVADDAGNTIWRISFNK